MQLYNYLLNRGTSFVNVTVVVVLPLFLIQVIVQVIDRTRSTPTTYSVVECYYLGNREAQAQPRATEMRNKESSRCERDGIRGRRQGVSESALPRTLRRTRWEK